MPASDKRRAAGTKTRSRLIEAMADALARTGPNGVSMRGVTTAAGVNVAAVKYHFGSREDLIDAVLADATGRIAAEQDRNLSTLEARDEPPTAREWIEAWGGPLVGVALSDAPEQRRLGRIIANAVNEHTPLGPSLRESTSRADDRLLRGLARALRPADELDLRFRLSVMVTVLVGLSGATSVPELPDRTTRGSLGSRVLDVLEAIARSEPKAS